MGILSFKNRIPNPSLLNNTINEGSIQAIGSNAIAAFFAINVPEFVPTAEKMRNIQWARTDLWAYRFVENANFGPALIARQGGTNELSASSSPNNRSIPKLYEQWVPATNIEDQLANVEVATVETAFSTYVLPKNTSSLTMTVEYMDDQDGTLMKWFEEWMNIQMFGRESASDVEQHVLTLAEAARQIQYMRLDVKREVIEVFNYLVIPTGDLTYVGETEGGVRKFSVSFYIVGKTEGDRKESLGSGEYKGVLREARDKAVELKREARDKAVELKRKLGSFGFQPFF